MQKTVLFLCTANYYRSRYSELFFNHLADERRLDWKADSRGILAAQHDNPGPIYSVVADRLSKMGIRQEGAHRYPKPLKESDLLNADMTIALKETEHRPMMKRLFPGWADRIVYWHIHDIDVEPPAAALPQIDVEMIRLVERLGRGEMK